ncbi:PilN domain-containing protein [Paraconexibacter algicola]|uniref:Uncharacterized protein n=1 Tax=Paraconexibacter algicola TaxID=2133960 RepID=A0A2T4UC46_9ACTN|nr:PilN domain-containing protein [Paraconexibacter algicola]PTL54761.1 hypothetical protein C7Y72_19390 [Paraconexibacter algicola]
MKAVNLIPLEERRGAGGAAGRSGGAVYVLLGALAMVVIALATLTLTGKRIDDRKAELASVQQQVAAEQARAAELQAYATFRALREARVQTVTSLANSRFDWGAALHEVSRVVPRDVWLTQLNATAAPGVAAGGGGTGASTLRSALAVPAIELTGCTTSQPGVARAMAAFRRIDGVQRVTLASSEKGDAAQAGSSGSGDCRQGRDTFPQFSMVLFFDPPAGGVAPATPGTATAAPAAVTGPTGATGAAPSTATAQLQGSQAAKDAALATQEEDR